MDLGIAGRRAIVCASSSGLGFACAAALAAEGVDVVINGRDPDRLTEAATRLATIATGRIDSVTGDLLDPTTYDRLLDACPEPDIVVTNNAGPKPGRLREATQADWTRAIEGNLLNHLRLIDRVLDGMRARGFGRIVNITSAMVTTPRPEMAVSSGVRSALTAVVKGLSIEAAPDNVTINNLLPERIDSGRQIQMANIAVEQDGITFEEARRRQAASIAAKRLGRPEELGAACAFLCSVHAGFISGQNLHLDGGSYPALV
jgi:3-oxoacyl-[acyl-carrier protein] reductase